MSKHNSFQKQINKYLDQVPVSAINSNEILLRLIANELAVIADGIGTLAHIDFEAMKEGDEDDAGDTDKSDAEP